MPIFYRGAALGTYWHKNDARLTGFTSHYPGAGCTLSRVMQHIVRGTTASPYVSLTRSYGIALGYALAGCAPPTPSNPAFVYEIEIDELDGLGTRLLDPLTEVVKGLGSPYDSRPYQHDGEASFLLGIADPVDHHDDLNQPVRYAPPGQGTMRSPLLGIELECMVLSLRDAEVLAVGAVAKAQVHRRICIR